MAGPLFQNSYYVVNIINAILYGIELVLYFRVLRHMYDNRTRTPADKFMAAFCTALLVLNTINWATQAYFCQTMWIVHADYPGGPDAYWADLGNIWYNIWGTAASIVCNLMNDAFLVYRCFVIWNSRRIVVLPLVLWCASVAFAIGLLYETALPAGNYFAGLATAFVTSYTASTFAFNLLVTALIVARIVRFKRQSVTVLPAEAHVYTGAVAIVVESALPFTVFSAVYLVTYAAGSDIAVAFSFYAMFTCISPLLITLRVLARRAWTRESGTMFTTTISYRGATDYVTTTGMGAALGEHHGKMSRGGVAAAEKGPAADVQEVDVAELPV